ncbi:acid protease [Chiua virens]|nr:acid protease [Chiua virens]
MFLRLALLILCLTTSSLSTPVHLSRHHPKYINRISRTSASTRPPSLEPGLDKNTALTAQAATLRKYQNAPALLAGQDTSLGYTIPPSLQDIYDRTSDHATNILFLKSQPNSLANTSPYLSSAFGVAGTRMLLTAANYSVTDPLTDETDQTDDYEYYGPLAFGSQGQALQIDFDTGSADLWVTAGCTACGSLLQFQTTGSNTYRNTAEPFSVTYGLGFVNGTLARDTVAMGHLVVPNQTFGVVDEVSLNFDESPSDGLAGLAFSTIARSQQPTFFENVMPQLDAPLFSVFMTRAQVHGSEILFGGIDVSKVIEEAVTWVQVISKTWWTVSMSGLWVNNTLVHTDFLLAIIDTGTSYTYVPSTVASNVYAQIPGSALAPEYGAGYYKYKCDPPVTGRYEADPTGRTCIGAIVGSDQFEFAILGVSFLKTYVTIFDYSHDGRVGFVKSITAQ